MRRLYYMRHGESRINTGDVWGDRQGSTYDLGLTELGRSQVKSGAIKTKESGMRPDVIICSPLQRTRETAAIVADVLGYPQAAIEYSELFLEVQVGELEGTSYSAFVNSYSYADFDKFNGAETIEALQQRAAQALSYIQSRPEETVLVISHSCFGRAFRRVIENRPYTDEFLPNTLPLPYGEATLLISPDKLA